MAGHIEERGNKTYRLIVSDGFNFEGKRLTHKKTMKCNSCKKDSACSKCNKAKKELALFVAEVEGGRCLEGNKITFASFIDVWLKDHAEKNLAPKTLHRYKQLIERIKFSLGHIRMDKLKPKHFNDFYNNLLEAGVRKDKKNTGLSPQTILHHHRLINTILNAAVEWEIINRNPAQKAKPPKFEKKEPKYYDEEHLKKFFEALEGEKLKWKLACYLVFATGMRKGEVMGVEWPDVNEKDCSININRVSQYVDKKIITKSPKNKGSIRKVTIPQIIMDMLKEYKREQNKARLLLGDKWKNSKRIFTTDDGADLFPDAFAQWFRRFIKRHKLPHISLHGLRHTNASFLLAEGQDIKTVAERLGHKRASTLLDIYTHAIKKADKEAVNRIENLINISTKHP